jgi:hypothetical protein
MVWVTPEEDGGCVVLISAPLRRNCGTSHNPWGGSGLSLPLKAEGGRRA